MFCDAQERLVNSRLGYAYASGDLLEQRNTYFYSAYRGEAFLDAWRQQRHGAETDLAADGAASNDSAASGEPTPTDLLLESIHRELSTNGKLTQNMNLDCLVQRFEVSKRLHGEYDARWRPVDAADYRSFDRYLRFAEILHLAYGCTARLTYLNVMLKVVDTLTAMRHLLTAHHQTRLKKIIAYEQKHIDDLSAQVRARKHAP
jgi:methionyl-tRNA formyltransferase